MLRKHQTQFARSSSREISDLRSPVKVSTLSGHAVQSAERSDAGENIIYQLDGMGTPEIYEEQLNLFRLPLLSKTQQEQIILEINSQLSAQDGIKKQIRSKYDEIAAIVQQME